MLKQEGDLTSLKMIDFGIGQFTSHKQWIITKCGSPSYIAQEVFTNKRYNNKCDIFSLGIIAFILLTEEMPFDAEDIEMVLYLNEHREIDFSHSRLQ